MPLRSSSDVHECVVVAAIDGGRGNALDTDIVSELAEAVASLSDSQALVVTGRPGMFTGGLDTAVLATGGEPAAQLLRSMGRLLLQVLHSARPIVVAADGHGVAAGAMLMLASDYTLVSDRDAKFGFTEVARGMELPEAVVELVRARANPTATTRLAAHGELVGPADAVTVGLADRVVPVDSLLESAVVRAAELAALPHEAYATTKARVTAPLAQAMSAAMSR